MMEGKFVKYSNPYSYLDLGSIYLLYSNQDNLGECIGCSMAASLVWKLPLSLRCSCGQVIAHARTTTVK